MIRIFLLIFLLSVQLLYSFAQTSPHLSDPREYSALITEADLQKHLTIIASDSMEGRETGTDGQRRAAEYIEQQFKNIGLKIPDSLKGHKQFYPLFYDSMTSSILQVAKTNLQFGKDYYVQAVHNKSSKITADNFVFAGYGISEPAYDDYKDINVKGKVVVFFTGEPKINDTYIVTGTTFISKYTYPGIRNKLIIAKNKGAVAAIVINPLVSAPVESIVSASLKSDLYFPREDPGYINYITISHAAAVSIFKKWNIDNLLKKATIHESFTNKKMPEIIKPFVFDFKKEKKVVEACNVLGVLEGTDKKDEYLFITAHYDHLGKHNDRIYHGADDDGSGTCAVIEMATAFSKAKLEGNGPRRTLVFMTVSGEEEGLWGSEYYSEHPVFPLDKTTADLNTDMVGRIDPNRKIGDSTNYIYVIGHDKISSDLSPITDSVNNKYTKLEFDYKFDDPKDPEKIFYRSDHYNFARKGVPILFFFDGIHNDYHKPTDTVDKINWDIYAKRVRFIFHTAWEMANRDDMLKRDLPLPPEK